MKISKQDRAIITSFVKKLGNGNGYARPGVRYNTTKPATCAADVTTSINIAAVTDLDTDPGWRQTDLWDMTQWKDTYKDIPADAKGRVLIDLYVYSRGYWGELETNLHCYFLDGALVQLKDCGAIVWERKPA